jgi:peptide/nickel transport system permease protein
MPFQLVALWTDVLIFLLLAVAMAFAVYARRQEHLSAPWREVARSRVAMGALVILAAYATIGLLDSVHFRKLLPAEPEQPARYSADVQSVLDVLLGPLKVRTEKTYSAPFATQLLVKETLELPGGGRERAWVRLQHGGRHLDDEATGHARDISERAALGAVKGLAVWMLMIAAVAFASKSSLRSLWAERRGTRWRAALLTLAVLLVLGGVLAEWSGAYHVFGTDKVGRDVLYQALKSVRTGLIIGTLTTLVMLPFALALGAMAGYFGGLTDDVIQYLYTTLNSIPSVLLIAAMVLMLNVYLDRHAAEFASVVERADLRLLFLCLILGLTSWTGLCRLLRGEALKLREMDYVLAARALGASPAGILIRHVLPNVMHIVLITLVLDFSGLVLAEAVLSYVQIGVDPTTDSWGNMINNARLEMAREPTVWWSLAAAFLFMFALVLAANLFADAVRDAFDPRLRGAVNRIS